MIKQKYLFVNKKKSNYAIFFKKKNALRSQTIKHDYRVH